MGYEHYDYSTVRAVPYDVPILGFGGTTCNVLHLWDAQPVHDTIDMDAFNAGDYSKAMKERSEIEAITSILYPDDRQGKASFSTLCQRSTILFPRFPLQG